MTPHQFNTLSCPAPCKAVTSCSSPLHPLACLLPCLGTAWRVLLCLTAFSQQYALICLVIPLHRKKRNGVCRLQKGFPSHGQCVFRVSICDPHSQGWLAQAQRLCSLRQREANHPDLSVLSAAIIRFHLFLHVIHIIVSYLPSFLEFGASSPTLSCKFWAHYRQPPWRCPVCARGAQCCLLGSCPWCLWFTALLLAVQDLAPHE